MPSFFHTIHELTLVQVAWGFLGLNLLIFLASVGACWACGRMFARYRIFDHWEPFSPVELAAALGTVAINAAVSVGGWMLWKAGAIVLSDKSPGWWIFDALLMVLAMDLGMYVLHRLAHHPVLYRWFHAFHHRHEVTNPISLFVLHPFEVIGFGGLMIAFLMVYPMSGVGLVAYLTLNVIFGTLGHSGVEPFSRRLRKIPLFNQVGTSTFHAEHHESPRHNFGFYTLIWDQVFGTLDPDYWQRYSAAARGGLNTPSSTTPPSPQP